MSDRIVSHPARKSIFFLAGYLTEENSSDVKAAATPRTQTKKPQTALAIWGLCISFEPGHLQDFFQGSQAIQELISSRTR
jgi:hypothetical protein